MENSISGFCSVCHQAILPGYYFCPNCGNNLNKKPLDTSFLAQAELYIFSIILPMIAFIFVTRWQGNKYFKSEDPKTKQIGLIAWVLLSISTIITIYLVYIWTMSYIQLTVNSINTDFSGL